MSAIDTSVIISTYNSPERLERTLWGFGCQTVSNFEIIIADDGSTDETRELIRRFRLNGMPLRHVWHEDRGFRKNKILNTALCEADGQYCVFTDGDCIPRSDFVESHQRLRRHGQFLSTGSHINLPESIHGQITENAIRSGQIFQPCWLHESDSALRFSFNDRCRLTANPLLHRC